MAIRCPTRKSKLMRRGYTQGRMRLQVGFSANSDDRGRFRITGVPAGRYYVGRTTLLRATWA